MKRTTIIHTLAGIALTVAVNAWVDQE